MFEVKEVLKNLNFGSVDSESEANLDKIFIQTKNFTEFLRPDTALLLGSKGAGKSALYRLFSKFEDSARQMSNHQIDDVYLVSGIGFKDVSEMDDTQIINRIENDEISAEASWKIYITYKIIHALYSKYEIVCGEKSKRVLQKSGDIKDRRLFGLLSTAYRKLIGELPKVEQIDFSNVSISVSRDNSISIYDLLNEINEYMEKCGKTVWVLLDKIDEIFSQNIARRRNCIEGLFVTYIDFVSRFSNLKLKIFLRTDIWSTLSFVNKSHLTDKTTIITWNGESLKELLLKRACYNDCVCTFLKEKTGVNSWTENPDSYFDAIFPAQVYGGPREAKTLSWIIERATDGLGGVYPREIINFANFAVDEELMGTLNPDATSLLSGLSIRKAYGKVSSVKVESYLSEFSVLEKHFSRFSGQQKADYTREELFTLMSGLEPSGEEMISQLHEAGVLMYSTQNALTPDTSFTVPRLFRAGLGIVTMGRP